MKHLDSHSLCFDLVIEELFKQPLVFKISWIKFG